MCTWRCHTNFLCASMVRPSVAIIALTMKADPHDYRMMFLGRIISGMGIGYDFFLYLFPSNYYIRIQLVLCYRVLLQVCPLYIAEIAPKEKRGVMGAFVNSFSTTGSVVRMI